jgi:hypothetical protein
MTSLLYSWAVISRNLSHGQDLQGSLFGSGEGYQGEPGVRAQSGDKKTFLWRPAICCRSGAGDMFLGILLNGPVYVE